MKSSEFVRWCVSALMGWLVACSSIAPTPTSVPTLTPEPKREPQILARSVPNGIVSFAMDEANLYWSTCRYSGGNIGRGNVFKVAKTGGDVITLASEQICPRRIALDAGNVYWVNEGEPNANGEYFQGALMRVAKTGGTATTLVSKMNGHAELAVDEASVYWSDCNAGTVLRIAKDSAAPAVIAQRQACPAKIVVDEANVYWSARDAIRKSGKRGGEAETLVASSASALVADNESIYWTRTERTAVTTFRSCADERSALMKIAKAGGVPAQLAALNGLAPDNLAVTANEILWSTDCANALMRLPKSGGEPNALVPNQIGRFIAADEKNIYWVVYADGTVMQKSK